MTYALLSDLFARAGETEILQVADRDDDNEPDADVVSAALEHADNIINGYLRSRYSVPLTAVPDLVRTWAVAIARYFLHRYGAPDYVEHDYKDALAALKDVAAGRITLPAADDGETPTSGTGSVLATHPRPHFDTRGWGQ